MLNLINMLSGNMAASSFDNAAPIPCDTVYVNK